MKVTAVLLKTGATIPRPLTLKGIEKGQASF